MLLELFIFSNEMQRLRRYILIIAAVILTVYTAKVAKPIFIPIVYAAILAMLFLPFHQRWVNLTRNRFLGVILTLLTILIPILLVVVFFSFQIADVMQNLPSIGDALEEGLNEVVTWISENQLLRNVDFSTWAQENLNTIVEQPINWLKFGISESTATLSSFVLTFIYLLFFLLYEKGIKRGVLMLTKRSQTNWQSILSEISRMIEKYLGGMAIVVGILAFLNSCGLWLIGVDYPMFWGILASLLALIPYLGTMLGGAFPMIYSIAVGDSWWQPLLVFFLFGTIQFIEGNFITPKVVGDQVSLNPLTAIMALIIGAWIWGLSGVVLAIPMAAIFRIVANHFEGMKPIAFFMGPDISHQ